ncbi:hypothetical protein LO771_17040 [Streptacidiphilus sp. ASG 303]|uniref:hypothetical protein n=1 Tax=Streptacidiphilus sp. ASG 303 TaxID=2896847 RepID=UPI001E2D291D|nr:hypothetical protein [Streptacidiphilus sp. ASG 303]MCD0484051.1 hypothetical protein [Streptacidiphilus sp. ASG 303]
MSKPSTATARSGPGGAPAHRTARAAARALAAVLLALCAAFIGAATAEAADGGLVKVFVVQDPARTGGRLATLESVAAATLGDPARAGEVFALNRGQAQRDGGALNSPADPLHPGWILRLPQDASGAAVQLARDTAAQGQSSGGAAGAGAAAGGTPAARTTVLTVPLPAAAAALGALLLALVTAGIVARRRLGRMLGAGARLVHRLGAAGRRRRTLRARRSAGSAFASDTSPLLHAHSVLARFEAAPHAPATPVHALTADRTGVTVWLDAPDLPDPSWQHLGGPRWHRPAGAPEQGAADPGALRAAAEACPVRVGTGPGGGPLVVDLSRLDGVLSVTGDRAVALDVARNLLAEVGRSRPGTPLIVMAGTEGGPTPAVPPGLRQVFAEEGRAAAVEGRLHGPVRGAASRRPVRGLVLVAGTPTGSERAALAGLCGPDGSGWTGIVCGEVDGAHWRWHADEDGSADIPVLGVRTTVPA